MRATVERCPSYGNMFPDSLPSCNNRGHWTVSAVNLVYISIQIWFDSLTLYSNKGSIAMGDRVSRQSSGESRSVRGVSYKSSSVHI